MACDLRKRYGLRCRICEVYLWLLRAFVCCSRCALDGSLYEVDESGSGDLLCSEEISDYERCACSFYDFLVECRSEVYCSCRRLQYISSSLVLRCHDAEALLVDFAALDMLCERLAEALCLWLFGFLLRRCLLLFLERLHQLLSLCSCVECGLGIFYSFHRCAQLLFGLFAFVESCFDLCEHAFGLFKFFLEIHVIPPFSVVFLLFRAAFFSHAPRH